MVSAISSPAFPAATDGGTSIASLEARLARYQKTLSECVSCSSAKTPEGKEAIQDLANRISEVKARIERISAVKPGTPPPGQGNVTAQESPGGATAYPVAAYAAPGSRLDLYA